MKIHKQYTSEPHCYNYISSAGKTIECFSNEAQLYNPVSITERAAYIAPRTQILNFLMTGEIVNANRREAYFQSQYAETLGYEMSEDKLDIELPLTRQRGFDMIDALNYRKSYTDKLKAYEMQINARKQEDLERQKKEYEEFLRYKEQLKENKTPSSEVDL